MHGIWFRYLQNGVRSCYMFRQYGWGPGAYKIRADLTRLLLQESCDESLVFYCESPGLRLRPNRACTNEVLDIRRANLYEQVARQCGLRIQAAIAGVHRTEQSTFMPGGACASRHVRLL